jgi:hypothetical protein
MACILVINRNGVVTMKKQARLNAKIMPIAVLLPAGYNPRKDLTQEDAQYQQLKKSIQEFDYVDPLIYNTQTKTLVSGHQRLKILKELDYDEVEVNCVNLDGEREKALNIALNKITGEWDSDKLAELFEDLSGCDIDLDDLGIARECFAELEDFALSDVVGSIERNVFSGTLNEIASTFAITFEFPKEKQEHIASKLKENGKSFYTSKLLEVLCA